MEYWTPIRGQHSEPIDTEAPGYVQDAGLWKTTVPTGELKEIYWFGSSAREDLVIACSPGMRCEGNLDLKDLGLEATLIFNPNAVAQHAVIVGGLRTLLTKWHLEKQVTE